ncbi:biotin/lipoyl-binding protein [Devosia ginsengisoli]|uniref:Biotin/lipoyl-binding protein n=1 Tax=Devosia ginsengisoli TaxID=400770 RepID=A0A5B8LM57_9HYPH|nr:biotin/lipoyl-binding protein [Devosia ginsengisoli]QDZ09288.1 biotin/lipoyl-binding protein [Devosia ginsengisoli]
MNEFLAGVSGRHPVDLSPQPGRPAYSGYLEGRLCLCGADQRRPDRHDGGHAGQSVAAGDVLFTLDTSQQQNRLDAAEARVSWGAGHAGKSETGGRSEGA